MDFGFSENQREVQQLARQILSEQVTAEKLAQYDNYASHRFDRDLWQQLSASGLLGVAIEEAHGGMGFGFFELALLIEEAGRVLAPLPLIPHAVSASQAVQKFGSEQLKAELLPGCADGSLVLSAALANDPTSRLPEAVADGDGYKVSGEILPVPYAKDAHRILVPAQCEGGIALLLVDPAAAGVTLTEVNYTTYEPLFALGLDGVVVDGGQVLAGSVSGSGSDEDALGWVTERTVAALCAHQLGITDVAMRMTASYTAEREQFGVPIATFQAVGHRAANCFIDVECLRLNTYQAVSLLDMGQPATTEVQVAKVWAGDVGHRVSYASQHLHGGTGIDRDYPLWRFCLWARHNEAALGGSARQLADLGKRIAAGEAYCS